MKTVYGLFSCLCTQFTPQLPLNLSSQTFVGLDLQLCLTTCDMWRRDSRRVLTTWSVLQYLISDNQKKITVGEREIPCWCAWMVVNCETSPTIFSHGSPTPDARGDLGGKLVIHFFVELLRLEKSLHFWKKTDSGCLSLPPPPSPPKIKKQTLKKEKKQNKKQKKNCATGTANFFFLDPNTTKKNCLKVYLTFIHSCCPCCPWELLPRW